MATAASFIKTALSLEDASAYPHFNKTAFKAFKKTFATIDEAAMKVSLKLTEADQSVYCQLKPPIAASATGAWGKQGWTVFDLKKTPPDIVRETLRQAHTNVQPAKKTVKKMPAKKVTEQIQTLHPDPTKTNKRIALAKYEFIKKELLAIVKKQSLTHTDLMEALYQRVKDVFEGGVQWYGETVKLDLEARKIIERTGEKPDRYRLSHKGR
jgi:hypothetical protein